MYFASPASWNLRDGHMFNTLEWLLEYYGPESRGIVWAHNSLRWERQGHGDVTAWRAQPGPAVVENGWGSACTPLASAPTTARSRLPRAGASHWEPRRERGIGVIYRPETELDSHYFYASLPQQFNELIWCDETRANDALPELPERFVLPASQHPLAP